MPLSGATSVLNTDAITTQNTNSSIGSRKQSSQIRIMNMQRKRQNHS